MRLCPFRRPAFHVTRRPRSNLGWQSLKLSFKTFLSPIYLIAIAKQGGVEISIQGDVGGTLKFVHYKSVTAEEAIERVAVAAGLSWGRRGTQYIVTKSEGDLPTDLRRGAQGSTQASSQAPKGSGVSESFAPIAPPRGWDNNSSSSSSTGNRMSTGDFIPDLYEKKDAKTKLTSVVRVHNVPPRMMAYWLNPANNGPDNLTLNSQRNFNEASDTRTLRPVTTQGFDVFRNSGSTPYPYPYPGQIRDKWPRRA